MQGKRFIYFYLLSTYSFVEYCLDQNCLLLNGFSRAADKISFENEFFFLKAGTHERHDSYTDVHCILADMLY